MAGASQPALRCIVLIADASIMETAAKELADGGPFRVKAFVAPQKALPSIPAAQPHAIVVQNGANARQLVMARQVAELASSRKVPIVMFGGPLDETLEPQRQRIGIHEVIDGEFQAAPVLAAIKACIGRVDQARKTDRIRQNLARAASRLKPTDPPSQ